VPGFLEICPDFRIFPNFQRDDFFDKEFYHIFFSKKMKRIFPKKQILKKDFIHHIIVELFRLKINTLLLFSMSLEFHSIIRSLNFEFQNQYPKREAVITIPVCHLLIKSTGKTAKKFKL